MLGREATMTEAEWRSRTYPPHLLGFLRGRGGDRKFRLFACACARRVAHLVKDGRAKAALGFAEQMAERGNAGRKGRPSIHKAGREACEELWRQDQGQFDAAGLLAHLAESNATHAAVDTASTDPAVAAEGCTAASLAVAYASCRTPRTPNPFPPDRGTRIAVEEQVQVGLLRDIFGDPFRPATFDPAWRTPTAVALAGQMYESRDFGAMPILADALQDAGCDSEEVLGHCREPKATHVRGCWVVDLVLGKE
jgi:hypothetical protein